LKSKVHVKKGDTVIVLSGKDKGKKGKILRVLPSEGKVLVEGVNMVTKHVKPRSATQQGGRVEQESPINSSKVMLVCNRCHKPTRIGKVLMENGQKARKCKKCDEIIDVISTDNTK
jgi:large subunit ribosomal protein L24